MSSDSEFPRLYTRCRAMLADGRTQLDVYRDVTGWNFEAFDTDAKRRLAGPISTASEEHGRAVAKQWAIGSHRMTTPEELNWFFVE